MKNLFKNREFQLDEILFENRNKEYGAYVLRHESDKILTKSMFIGLAFIAIISAVPLLINALKPSGNIVIETPTVGPIDLDNVDRPDVKVEDPVIIPPKQDVKTFDSSVPTPTKDPKVEKPAAKVEKYDDAVAGLIDKDGVAPTVPYTPPATVPAGPAIETPAPQPTVDPQAIATKVDVEASFSGGIDSFRNKVMNSFDTSGFEGSGDKIRTTVTFVVEKDGSISNIKANGPDAAFNREAERTVKSVKGKWIPAKVKGEPVRSYFKFPVTMIFE